MSFPDPRQLPGFNQAFAYFSGLDNQSVADAFASLLQSSVTNGTDPAVLALLHEVSNRVANLSTRLETAENDLQHVQNEALQYQAESTRFEQLYNDQRQQHQSAQSLAQQAQYQVTQLQAQLNIEQRFSKNLQSSLDMANAQLQTRPPATSSSGSSTFMNIIKNVKPPRFSGKDVITWHFQIREYFDSAGASLTDTEKINVVKLVLDERALSWYRSQSTLGTTYATLEQLLSAIFKEFVDLNHVDKLRTEFESLSMSKCSNNVQSYTRRARDLLNQMGPVHRPSDEHCLWRFKQGLSQQMRLLLTAHEPLASFADACTAVDRISQNLSNIQTSTTQLPQASKSVPMELGSMHMPQKSGNSDQNAWKKQANCHYCGKKGHIRPDCLLLQRHEQQGAVQNPSPAQKAKQSSTTQNRGQQQNANRNQRPKHNFNAMEAKLAALEAKIEELKN